MNLLASLRRPEYIFRPIQILRRVRCELRAPNERYRTVQLPWGLPIRVEPREALGAVLVRAGIYDLHACECISRLLEPGELAVDVGANIGQMTSIMARRAGPSGQVISVEPHPVMFGELEQNAGTWRRRQGTAPIVLHHAALGDRSGVAQLVIPPGFEDNHMLAFLAEGAQANADGECHEVPIETLDEIVGDRAVAFLKIDVEGHELQVLRGARRLMEMCAIRDILFEEHRTPPTPVTEFLAAQGYSVYSVGGSLTGPLLRPSHSLQSSLDHRPVSLLATRAPDRLIGKMAAHGWSALRRY